MRCDNMTGNLVIILCALQSPLYCYLKTNILLIIYQLLVKTNEHYEHKLRSQLWHLYLKQTNILTVKYGAIKTCLQFKMCKSLNYGDYLATGMSFKVNKF